MNLKTMRKEPWSRTEIRHCTMCKRRKCTRVFGARKAARTTRPLMESQARTAVADVVHDPLGQAEIHFVQDIHGVDLVRVGAQKEGIRIREREVVLHQPRTRTHRAPSRSPHAYLAPLLTDECRSTVGPQGWEPQHCVLKPCHDRDATCLA